MKTSTDRTATQRAERGAYLSHVAIAEWLRDLSRNPRDEFHGIDPARVLSALEDPGFPRRLLFEDGMIEVSDKASGRRDSLASGREVLRELFKRRTSLRPPRADAGEAEEQPARMVEQARRADRAAAEARARAELTDPEDLEARDAMRARARREEEAAAEARTAAVASMYRDRSVKVPAGRDPKTMSDTEKMATEFTRKTW